MGAQSILSGRRILVVEDNPLILLILHELLVELKCIIVGPFSQVDTAIRAAHHEALDAAVLDVYIHGRDSIPVAEVLSARKIPVILATGAEKYGPVVDHPEWRMVSKPFRGEQIIEALSQAVLETSAYR